MSQIMPGSRWEIGEHDGRWWVKAGSAVRVPMLKPWAEGNDPDHGNDDSWLNDNWLNNEGEKP